MEPTGRILDPLAAFEALRDFSGRHGRSALVLAMHAAVPEGLRVDMLAVLRRNFLPPDQAGQTHLDAAVLFASFCEHLGGEYFRFDPEVRLQLVQYLNDTYANEDGPRSARVAACLLAYIDHMARRAGTRQDRILTGFLETQRWVALGFFDPQDAAEQVAQALADVTGQPVAQARLRLGSVAAVLTLPLGRYRALLDYAFGVQAVQEGNREAAAHLLGNLEDVPMQVGDRQLDSPREVLRKAWPDTRAGAGTAPRGKASIAAADTEPSSVLPGLKERLEAHRDWLESNGQKGRRADLSGFAFQGASLPGARLDRAILDKSDLRGVDLSRASLAGASLKGALLDETRLPAATLDRADLTGTRLERANLPGASLNGAMLDNASLEQADLRLARINDAKLVSANLNGAVLEHAELHGADLSGATLEHAILARASLRGARLLKTRLAGADFTEADLTDAELQGVDFRKANVDRARFGAVDLRQARFTPAQLAQIHPGEEGFPDVFLSHAFEDAETVDRIEKALVSQGLQVWRATETLPGEQVGEALERSKVIVVLWSRHSVISASVIMDAEFALRRNVLIPVRVDGAEPPEPFADIQPWTLGDSSGIHERLMSAFAVALRKHLPASGEIDMLDTKLEMAHAYLDLGHGEWAEGILGEVLEQGNEGQRREAHGLLEKQGTAEGIPEPLTVFRDRLRGGGEGPEMVVIPAGAFWMGSDKQRDQEAFSDEQPRHRVRIGRSFGLGRYPVTFEEYEAFCRDTGQKVPLDQGWGRGRRPVINVSWEDAVAYCAWLGEQTGRRYRLPSEAEWEYACRAGSETVRWWGDDLGKGNANCDGCGSRWDGKQTAPVGSFRPNPWGLSDTLGNVWEWVQDCWHDDYQGAPVDGSAWEGKAGCLRVLRGGAFFSAARDVRSASRYWYSPDSRLGRWGFRVVLSPLISGP